MMLHQDGGFSGGLMAAIDRGCVETPGWVPRA
jgi:hypothetical protein